MKKKKKRKKEIIFNIIKKTKRRGVFARLIKFGCPMSQLKYTILDTKEEGGEFYLIEYEDTQEEKLDEIRLGSPGSSNGKYPLRVKNSYPIQEGRVVRSDAGLDTILVLT